MIHYGYIILPASLLWVAIENYLWHLGWFQKLFRTALNIPPDIRGRWEGTILIDGVPEPHPFILEIHQTLTRMQVYTFSNHGRSKSESLFTTITSDEMEKNFVLSYMWQADAGAIPEKNLPAAIFRGFTMLNIYENATPKELSGSYFTNRQPQQTKGEIKLQLVSRKRKGKQ